MPYVVLERTKGLLNFIFSGLVVNNRTTVVADQVLQLHSEGGGGTLHFCLKFRYPGAISRF